MRDPLIHAPEVISSYGDIRHIYEDLPGFWKPKTVRTGCGRRRPYAMTSRRPDAVTCLACRDRAAAQHERHAIEARTRLRILAADLTDQAQRHDYQAAAFRGLP